MFSLDSICVETKFRSMIYNAMVELACVGLAAPLSAHVLHTSSEKLFFVTARVGKGG